MADHRATVTSIREATCDYLADYRNMAERDLAPPVAIERPHPFVIRCDDDSLSSIDIIKVATDPGTSLGLTRARDKSRDHPARPLPAASRT